MSDSLLKNGLTTPRQTDRETGYLNHPRLHLGRLKISPINLEGNPLNNIVTQVGQWRHQACLFMVYVLRVVFLFQDQRTLNVIQ